MNKLLLAGLLFLMTAPLHASSHTGTGSAPPQASGRVSEYESNLRFFYKTGKFQWAAETKERWEYEGQVFHYRDLTVGLYDRLHKNIKVGAFYRAQQGARHDDDWIRNADGSWKWRDTRKRTESLFILDATPRMELPFGSRRNWVASLKNQYVFNAFNSHHTYKIRPELTYFWMKGLNPFMNFFAHYELYIPLNYGESAIYETWFYAGALYHPHKNFSVGGHWALRDTFWSSSQEWKDAGGTYKTHYKAQVLGLFAIFQFQTAKNDE